MSDFDQKLKELLSETEEALIEESLDGSGYWDELFGTLRAKGGYGWVRVGVWIFVTVAVVLMIYAIWQFFHAETVKMQIFYAALAVFCNQGQIAFKLWFSMHMNRRASLREIKRLRIQISQLTRYGNR